MKRFLLFIVPVVGLFSISTTVAQSHDGDFSFSAETRYEAAFGAGKEFSAIDVDAVFGYHFNNRWSIIVPITASTGLFRAGNIKSHETTLLAGVGCEYNIISNTRHSLGLSPRVQASLFGDWKHLCYDVGLRWRWASSPYVGIGVRYVDTYDSPFKNRCCIYAAFGFTLF